MKKFLITIKQIIKTKWCKKFQSFLLGLKYGGIVLVAPKTAIKISKNAKIYINGVLEINKPWDTKQVFPAVFFADDYAQVSVYGKFTFFSGCRISVNSSAKLILDDGFMNENGVISCFKEITIGKGTVISNDVIIRDSDNHKLIQDNYCNTAPVRIGDHCWIGMRSIILKGVSINNGSVIAAGAVVNKNVPISSLVGGIPAQIIKNNVEWER